MANPRRAVVIGVNEYKKYDDGKTIPSLRGAVNDATEMCERLRKYGDFEIGEQHFLTAEKATSDRVRSAMSDLLWKTDSCDMALFYFSGHGFQDGYGNGYIAPYDLKYEEPLVHGIRIQELKEHFLSARNKQKALLILDCCHSGIATEGDKDLPAARTPFYQCLSDSGGGPSVKASGKFILASSGADEKSREIRQAHQIRGPGEGEHEHGVFTFHMLEGMDVGAAGNDGVVTLARLQKYVSDKMDLYQAEHECTFWGFGAGSFEEARIVNACRKQNVDKLVQSATESLAEGNVPSLFKAIDFLRQALTAYPESVAALAVKVKIDCKLQQECGQPISLWLLQHNLDYLQKFREYRNLEKYAAKLCFDEIARLDPARMGLLSVLFRVSTENLEVDVLENFLRALESPSLAQPVGKASVDVKGSS
jgi:uncharacterized caspase-like protein